MFPIPGFFMSNLCPENLLLSFDRKVKIGGFSMAQKIPIYPNRAALDYLPKPYSPMSRNLPYASPEQRRNEDYNHKVTIGNTFNLLLLSKFCWQALKDLSSLEFQSDPIVAVVLWITTEAAYAVAVAVMEYSRSIDKVKLSY